MVVSGDLAGVAVRTVVGSTVACLLTSAIAGQLTETEVWLKLVRPETPHQRVGPPTTPTYDATSVSTTPKDDA